MALKIYELTQLRNTIFVALRTKGIGKGNKTRAEYETACSQILPPLNLSLEKEKEAKRIIREWVGI
jgi:hypothetical protein